MYNKDEVYNWFVEKVCDVVNHGTDMEGDNFSPRSVIDRNTYITVNYPDGKKSN